MSKIKEIVEREIERLNRESVDRGLDFESIRALDLLIKIEEKERFLSAGTSTPSPLPILTDEELLDLATKETLQ